MASLASRSHRFFIIGAVFCFVGVILGAMAAHALEQKITPDQIDSFQTGVQYQLMHGMMLIVLGLLQVYLGRKLAAVGMLWFVGTFLFSLSIYLLALNDLYNWDATRIALVTPVGGTLIIIGWALLIIDLIRNGVKVQQA